MSTFLRWLIASVGVTVVAWLLKFLVEDDAAVSPEVALNKIRSSGL